MPDAKPLFALNGPAPKLSGTDGRPGRGLHQTRDKAATLVLKAGADGAIPIPVIEARLSNPATREDFRHVPLGGKAQAARAAALLTHHQESPKA